MFLLTDFCCRITKDLKLCIDLWALIHVYAATENRSSSPPPIVGILKAHILDSTNQSSSASKGLLKIFYFQNFALVPLLLQILDSKFYSFFFFFKRQWRATTTDHGLSRMPKQMLEPVLSHDPVLSYPVLVI